MGESKSETQRKTREIGGDGFCKHFFEDMVDFEKDYQKRNNDYMTLAGLVRSYVSCNKGLFDDQSGLIPFPKWALKAIADAFERYHQRKYMDHDLDMTLDEAFGINEDKQESIKKLHARNKEGFFYDMNSIRMYFGLNVKDASLPAWKLCEYRKRVNPRFFYKFTANKETLLDAYHRA